jgi:uncharacterized protein (DUF2236 family)
MEHFWAASRSETLNPAEGIFGPHSVCWKINRESALFLGAGRAALLQLAHPWVAAALDQHSSLRSDPLARFHNTFRIVFTMVFGGLDQALAASRHLYELHTGIQGEVPAEVGRYRQGSLYAANEVNALLWVYATLIESALIAHDCVLPPLSNDERETYYSESARIAALFGIAAAALPPNWTAFEAYTRTMLSSDALGVNSLSRELGHGVLHGRGTWLPIPRWYRALTAAWLPARLRDEFSLEYDPREHAAATTAAKWLPLIYRRLPPTLRFVGPYHEAQARLAGRHINPLVRLSNHFWMGQPLMMFDESGRHG